jgi:hypothetical protein
MKTLYNLEVGDEVITEDGYVRTVLEVLTQSCLLSQSINNTAVLTWYTFKEIEHKGYTVKPKAEEKWVPCSETPYYVPNLSTTSKYNKYYWSDDDIDKTNLAHNLVFKTKQEAIVRGEEILEKIK